MIYKALYKALAAIVALQFGSAPMLAQEAPIINNGSNIVHSPFDKSYTGKLQLSRIDNAADDAEYNRSPNGVYGYRAVYPDFMQEGPWTTTLYIQNGTEQQLELTVRDHNNARPSATWINEKLLFVRVWWGRVVGTDCIIDVERGEFVYREMFLWDVYAAQQYQESQEAMIAEESEDEGSSVQGRTFRIRLECTPKPGGNCVIPLILVYNDYSMMQITTGPPMITECYAGLSDAEMELLGELSDRLAVEPVLEMHATDACKTCTRYKLVHTSIEAGEESEKVFIFTDEDVVEHPVLKQTVETLMELKKRHQSDFECAG